MQPGIVAEPIRVVSFKAGTAHRGVWEKWGKLEPKINARNWLLISAACLVIKKKRANKGFQLNVGTKTKKLHDPKKIKRGSCK